MGCTCFVITLGPLSVWRLSADLSPSLCPVVGLVTAFRAVRRLSTQMLSTPFAEGSYMDISILWLPSHILGICSSWKLMLGHKMILYFSHRIASEYMMVISSGLQCLCLLTLDLCYFCQLSTPATGHWPWTDWDDTAQWSNLGVHKDITSTVFELQKWFLHQNGVEFCKKCNANDKSD